MARYILYSSLIHLLAALVYAGLAAARTPPKIYDVTFWGGQSGHGAGRLEPAPLGAAPDASPPPGTETPKVEPPPSSEDAARPAIPKSTTAPAPTAPKPGRAAQKKEGRGNSPLGKGDTLGQKRGPVGGVGTALEIGGFGPGSAGTNSRFPHSWYVHLLYKKLWETWDHSNAGNKECTVTFAIARDGGLAQPVKITDSSGDGDYDFTARRAVEESTPFPPLPGTFREKTLEVRVRFRLQ
jgi:TonB family protein